jgi:hypothetical protein
VVCSNAGCGEAYTAVRPIRIVTEMQTDKATVACGVADSVTLGRLKTEGQLWIEEGEDGGMCRK